LVYPLTALSLAFSLLFPDTAGKTISLSIASHVFLSITAYALLALPKSLCPKINTAKIIQATNESTVL
jgi:ABC-type uncharacterized transport system permease subunit